MSMRNGVIIAFPFALSGTNYSVPFTLAERSVPFKCYPRHMNLSGRKAQAARNDEVILEAAREVFTADPGAPISAVAQRAGVGISALYRRYPSKEALLQKLSLDTLRAYVAAAEAALTTSDPWEAFVEFMRGALDARSGALTIRLAGAFAATEELLAEVPKAYAATSQLLDNALKAGVIREGVAVGDISL